MKILIVDDEPSIREILTFLFSKKNWEVLTAEDGYEALAVVKQSKPDIILTDINMPQKSNGEKGLNGIELIEQLKMNYPTDHPKIYVMSGFLDNKEKIEKMEIVLSYFEKPDLMKAVNEIINTYK